MADRRRQIQLLIGSRFDFTFEPETFTGKVVRRGATAGKGSPSHWQTCPHCDGGSRRDRFGRLQPCDQCNGQGRVRVDDYTGDTVVTDEARDISLGELIQRDTRRVKCPDCQNLSGEATGQISGKRCRRCQGTGEAPVAGSWLSEPSDPDKGQGDALDAMLDAIERRNLVGSYKELDLALAGIAHHANKPLRFAALTVHATRALRLLDELYIVHAVQHDDLDMFERSLLELALAYVDSRMPAEIRVPREVERNAKERERLRPVAKGQALSGYDRKRRDAQIRRWEREGRPRQWIAQQSGLSMGRLRDIINGRSEAA
jgi:hypothetical protein